MAELSHGILFVCLGNICRSPLAEAVARAKFAQAGIALPLASAGTGNWHVGEGADPRARTVARQFGYDLDRHSARQAESADFQRFDYVLAMDHDNLANLAALQPASGSAQLGLLLETGGLGEGMQVPDPYFGGDEGFVTCLELLERGIDGLILQLQSVSRDRKAAPKP